jgi:hypothetical protein
MADVIWVWVPSNDTIQHLAEPPDDIQLRWRGRTVCGIEDRLWRVSWENVDNAKGCVACIHAPFTLGGDHRGPP